MIDRDHEGLSLSRQCVLLGLSRSALYYTPVSQSAETLAVMRRIDELYLRYPFYGSRQMARHLAREGVSVGRHPGAPADALAGLGGDLPQAAHQRRAPRAPRVPVSAQRTDDRAAESGVVCGHHLHPGAGRLSVLGGDHGLGQPTGAGVAAVQHAGHRVLCGGTARGAGALRHAGDLQHRSRQPVHQHGIHRAAGSGRHTVLDGRSPVAAWTTCSSSGCGAR